MCIRWQNQLTESGHVGCNTYTQTLRQGHIISSWLTIHYIYIQNIRGTWIGAWLILWWKIGYKVMPSCSDYNCKLVALGGSTRGIGRAKSSHKFSHYSSIVAKFRKFEKVENRRASCSVVNRNSCNFLKFLSMLFVTNTCNQFFWLNLPKGA